MKDIFEKLEDRVNVVFLRRHGAIVVFSLLVAFLVRFQGQIFPYQAYHQGEIARDSIYAPRDLTIVDEEATQARRKASVANVRSVYDYNDMENKRVLQHLREAFSMARVTLIQKAEQSNLKELLRRTLEDTLGIQITPEDLEVLSGNEFSQVEENKIADLVLRNTENFNIVSSKALLTPELSKGIVRRFVRGADVSKEESLTDLTQIYDLEDVRGMMKKSQDEIFGKAYKNSRPQILTFAQKLIRPTLTYNQAETENRRQAAYDSDQNLVVINVRKGAIIVGAGSVIEPRQLTIINGLSQEKRSLNDWLNIVAVFLVCTILIETMFYYGKNLIRFKVRARDYFLITTSIVVIFVVAHFLLFMATDLGRPLSHMPTDAVNYILPLATVAMLARMLIGAPEALFVSMIMGFLGSLYLDNSIYYGLYFFITCLFACHRIAKVRKRVDLLKAGSVIGCLNAATAFIVSLLMAMNHPPGVVSLRICFVDAVFGFAGGLLSAFLLMAMATVAESVFNYTTDFKLLELGDQNSPLLRELMVQAPGTYHHSIIVGQLSEAAAHSIGENGLLARVSCLYHDIGKSKKPLYYVENQTYRQNLHNKLTPRMSARVIQAHVKDGIEMAEEAKLPQEIIDIIPQHHGTRLISYFYDMAKAQADPEMETLDEKDFRYEGPKPQTRLAGIILLSDGLEAITRTLDDPTPARIKGVVRDHINKIFAEGQLDETDLTLRDLSRIANSFTWVLTSIFHSRIDYPTGVVKDPATRLRKIHDQKEQKAEARFEKRVGEAKGFAPNDENPHPSTDTNTAPEPPEGRGGDKSSPPRLKIT